MVFYDIRIISACLSAELSGQNRAMNSQVPQIQWFVGLFLSHYVCSTGHHLDGSVWILDQPEYLEPFTENVKIEADMQYLQKRTLEYIVSNIENGYFKPLVSI